MHALDSIPSDTSREEAVASAIHAERGRLLDFIRSRVRFAEDAEDIVQDVLYQLVATKAVSEPIEKFASWLFTVARNRIIDWYRKRRPEPVSRLETDAGDDEPESLLLDGLFADQADTPDMVYLRERFWEELADALEELPAKQREAFVMHELEGMSFAEIAEETGVGVPTLLSRKRYAVAYLRMRLQDLYDELILS
jgi:RNA polymerase sigma factor (sigma-70 family)